MSAGEPPAKVAREVLRGLAKAELHCHLDGSVRPATLLELAREYGKSMPASDPPALYRYMVVSDARNLEDYLGRFAITLSVMQRAEAIERITYELIEDVAADGVRYVEIRFAPFLSSEEGMTSADVLEAMLRGIERGQRQHGTRGRVIVCALRNHPPELAMEMAELAVAFRGRGVVALDLAGGERGNPAARYAAAFQYARDHDLAVTVHAGEGYGPESVRQAVHICGANRLGHATRLIEDPSLAQYVNDRRIGLEICLTSNVQTRVAPTYTQHPLRLYFDRGMSVSLNTDNRLMSGTTLTDEYLHAARYLRFTPAELGEIALNGFADAFLPWEERRLMVDEARREIAEHLACA